MIIYIGMISCRFDLTSLNHVATRQNRYSIILCSLLLSFALCKVLCECLVDLFAAFTEAWREGNTEDDEKDDENAGRVSPVNGVAKDVTDECCCDKQPQELQGDEFGLVEAVDFVFVRHDSAIFEQTRMALTAPSVVVPKRTGVVAVTLSHEHPQERGNETKGDERGDNAVPRGRHKIGDEGFAKVEHKRNNSHTNDAVDADGNSDTLQMGFPTALLLTALWNLLVGGLGIVL